MYVLNPHHYHTAEDTQDGVRVNLTVYTYKHLVCWTFCTHVVIRGTDNKCIVDKQREKIEKRFPLSFVVVHVCFLEWTHSEYLPMGFSLYLIRTRGDRILSA